MGKKIGAIVAGAKLDERTVTVCTRGDLNAEIEDLQRQLVQADRDFVKQSLADVSPARGLAERIEVLREQMRADEHVFKFRALSAKAWSDLLAEHPPRHGHDEIWNLETFPAACVAACCVEIDGEAETLDAADVEALFDVLNSKQRDDLFDGAYLANVRSADVPFSVLASKILHSTEQS